MQSWFIPRSAVTAVTTAGLLAAAVLAADAQTAPRASSAPAGLAAAQQAAEPAPVARPHTTVTSGMDAASSYMFRGIYQEDRGVVAPAFLDMKIPLYAGNGRFSAVRANVGMWNSFHSGPTGAQGRSSAWYEADYYASLTATAGRWSPGAIFTLVTSPNNAFNTVYELGASIDFDDSDQRVPLAPRAFFVMEVAGQMDSGNVQGRYAEVSIKPTRPLGRSGPMTFGLAMPVKAGASLRGYYESGATGSPVFASAGVVPSVSVAGPRASFEVHAGLELMRLGAAPSAFNRGQRTKPIVTIGASVTY
jgi:hypothetical protein